VRIQTFAEGLFARLAHDLELAAGGLTGEGSREDKHAVVEAPLENVEVTGVLHGDRVDPGALSAADRRDILAKMQREVFHAGPGAVVRVEATVDPTGSARVRIVPPNGRAAIATSLVDVRDDEGAVRVTGSFDMSLHAIGSDVVKGPMNAFRVKDRVVVKFDLVFVGA